MDITHRKEVQDHRQIIFFDWFIEKEGRKGVPTLTLLSELAPTLQFLSCHLKEKKACKEAIERTQIET